MTARVTAGVDDPIVGLVRLAAMGDEAAFARIVRLHHGDMVRVCYVISGDQQLAAEATQSAWPIAWRKLGSLRDPQLVRSWLVAIAANEARQLVRRERRRTVMEIALDAGHDSSNGGDPGARVSDIDLANALARLSPDDRALLALRYVAGLNASELAGALGMTASGTRSRLARVLARLRVELRHD